MSEPLSLRVASYNVEFASRSSPEEIGRMLAPFKFDVIGFCEVPGGDWTARAGKAAGLNYAFVGKSSSANHKDKYKSILSRTPLVNTAERPLKGEGWSPASVVRAETEVAGIRVALYSLHIPGRPQAEKSAAESLARDVLLREGAKFVVLMGDFNNNLCSPPIASIEKAGYRSAWRDLKLDLSGQFTWNAIDPARREGVIDHIMYNRASGMRAAQGGIIELEKPLSDHKPIWAELLIPR